MRSRAAAPKRRRSRHATPTSRIVQAMIYAALGDKDRAFEALEALAPHQPPSGGVLLQPAGTRGAARRSAGRSLRQKMGSPDSAGRRPLSCALQSAWVPRPPGRHARRLPTHRSGSSAAQTLGATTGALNGKVTDQSGAALPGVTVVASSTAMMGSRDDRHRCRGRYEVPAVPPGEYTLAFSLPPEFQQVLPRGHPGEPRRNRDGR